MQQQPPSPPQHPQQHDRAAAAAAAAAADDQQQQQQQQQPPPPPPLQQPPAPPHHKLPWEAQLHLFVPLLEDHAARQAVRLVSREWRAAADQLWRAAAFIGLQAPLEPPAAAAHFLSSGAPFLGLRDLTICQLGRAMQLDALLRQLTPARVPALRGLTLAPPLGLQLGQHSPGGGFASLQLPQLQRLQTDDILLTSHGLGELAHLHQLTELSMGLTAPSPEVNFLNQFNPTAIVGVRGVAHLSRLTNLQALALPQLQEEDRDALSALTGLTRLSFSAGGKGAVGPSLRALTRLQALHISLAHRHEHFIVLHPKVDWQALRESLPQLRWLSITHLAANTFFAAPEVTWSDEAPTAHEVDLLVAALPHIQRVQLRLSYCRLAEEHATGEGEPQLLLIPDPDGRPRRFRRTIERVPVRQPGRRRADAWYSAWWQPALQAQLAQLAAVPGGLTAVDAIEALERYREDELEMAGWVRIRPGAHRTFDVAVEYSLDDGRGSATGGGSGNGGGSGSGAQPS